MKIIIPLILSIIMFWDYLNSSIPLTFDSSKYLLIFNICNQIFVMSLSFFMFALLDSHSILSHLFLWRTLSLGRSYILKIVGFTYIIVMKLRAIPFSHFRLRSMFFFRLIKSNPSTSFLVLIDYNQNGPSYYSRMFKKKKFGKSTPFHFEKHLSLPEM